MRLSLRSGATHRITTQTKMPLLGPPPHKKPLEWLEVREKPARPIHLPIHTRINTRSRTHTNTHTHYTAPLINPEITKPITTTLNLIRNYLKHFPIRLYTPIYKRPPQRKEGYAWACMCVDHIRCERPSPVPKKHSPKQLSRPQNICLS